jgi:hypothetical protein
MSVATSRAPRAPASTSSSLPPSERLRLETAAVRVSFTWLGVRKTLTPEQKAEAAESFGAEGQYLSAAKKLLDTRHPAYRAVTAVRGRVVSYWRGVSLPYPEPGVRLIRQDRVESFDRQMKEFKGELADAVADLDGRYDQLRSAARERLGRLYDPRDYPAGLADLFAVGWDFPATEPPDYLLRLKPELFEQERARVAARFDEAVTLAEQAFAVELAGLVSHLSERLGGGGGGASAGDGKPKVFRDSAVANLREFFDCFAELNVRSNEQLDELVERAKRIVAGVDPQELRDSDRLRQEVHAGLSSVRQTLDGLLVDKPRRRILRAASTPVDAQRAAS